MVFVRESLVSDVYSYRHLKPSTVVSVDFGSGFFLMYFFSPVQQRVLRRQQRSSGWSLG